MKMRAKVEGIDSLGVCAIESRLVLPEGVTGLDIIGYPTDEEAEVIIEIIITPLEQD